ncbi:MAG: energy-coupling factor ABC transporter ATP-binding protein, partial [archaeon GB-1867-035]|nr:energy-coupling factor ABC transporter ATP-binding protein [Candidatus Culexmicrobium profundum]
MGILFQNPEDQIFNPTVYEEISFTLNQLKLERDRVISKVHEVLYEVGLDVGILNRSLYKLSLGEKQLIALASTIVHDPDIILLDEPTSNLSLRASKKVEEVIRNLRNKGKVVVLATHDVELAARISDEVILLINGKVIAKGLARGILTREDLLELADTEPPITYRIWK